MILFPLQRSLRQALTFAFGALFFSLLSQVQGSDLIVAGGGGLLRLDAESWEVRQSISSDTGFTCVRIGPDGDIFALKTSTGTLYRFARPVFDPAGEFTSSSLQGAAAFTFGLDGLLISVRNTLIHRYEEGSSSPVQTIDLQPAGVRIAAGVATGPDGAIYASCRDTGRVFRVSFETLAVQAMPPRFGVPRGIAVDPDGLLLAADSGMLPALVRLAGDDRTLGGFFPGDLPAEVEFLQPVDLAVSPQGQVVVADLLGNQLLRFDRDLHFMDTPGQGTAAWQKPRSVAFTLPPLPVQSYADWQQEHFSAAELEDDSISGLYGDPTGDGKVNLLRYGLGAGPREPVEDRLPVRWTEIVDEQEFLFISYVRARGRDDAETRLEVSDNLNEWEFSPARLEVVEVEDLGDVERVTCRDLVPVESMERHFLRLLVTYGP